MTNRLTLLGGLLCFLLAPQASAANEVRQDEKGTYLGALFMSRAQAAPAKAGTTGNTVATKPAAPGAVITFVLSESPAAKADLRRNDVLLGYDKKAIRDGDHLAELIRKDKPNRKVQLLVLRGEKKLNVEVTLALGTALKPADREDGGRGKTGNRAVAQVSVWATPLNTGKVNLTVEYYTTEGNRKTFTCDEAAELTTELRKLPERERSLVRVALQRLKTYSEPKKDGGKEKPGEKK
jgi:hypothetical protein